MKYQAAILMSAALLASSAYAQVIPDLPENAEVEGWQVCNETSYILRVAAAAGAPGKIKGKGWMRLRPGQCGGVDFPLDMPRYVYAESSSAHQGGIREWKGTQNLCTSETDFRAKNCEDNTGSLRPYRIIPAGEQTSYFVEVNNYGRRAETAGLQRLLQDTGHKVSRVDGVSGRRTLRTARAFLKANKLPANLSTEKQIDALEEKALDATKDIGFTLCNESSHNIWVATGTRKKDGWESRGWWTAASGSCVQAVNRTLKGLDLHYFARQEQPSTNQNVPTADKILQSDKASGAQFCISEAIFTARGRETCLDDGYNTASFRPVSSVGTSAKLTLTDADFVSKSTLGLRR